MLCENSVFPALLPPACSGNIPTKYVKIIYSKSLWGEDSDSLLLCDECAERIKTDAKRHNYKVEVTPL